MCQEYHAADNSHIRSQTTMIGAHHRFAHFVYSKLEGIERGKLDAENDFIIQSLTTPLLW